MLVSPREYTSTSALPKHEERTAQTRVARERSLLAREDSRQTEEEFNH